MGQDFIHLDWDTNLFGFGVAKITLTNPDKAQLSQTLKILRKNNYRLAYWHIPVEKHESSHIAKQQGGYLADEKVTFLRMFNNSPDLFKSHSYTSAPYSDITPDNMLINLALQSAEYSRFNLDPKFPKELCEKLFTCWIMRSVSKEISWEVLVVKENNEILGFITLNIDGDKGSIGLIAVATHARGKGIGRALVTDANRLFAEKGLKSSTVVTQRQNLGACRLYESCGYRINNIDHVYHFWL